MVGAVTLDKAVKYLQCDWKVRRDTDLLGLQ